MTWMLPLALRLRRLFGRNDHEEALRLVEGARERDDRAARRVLDLPAHEARQHRAARTPTILLGSATDGADRDFRVTLPERELRGGGHWLVTGSTGSGKSYFALGILYQLLRRAPRHIVLIDMKGELAGLLRDLVLPAIASELPGDELADFMARVAVVSPFDDAATPPFQVLSRDPSLPIEAQAHEVGSSFGRTVGRDLGILQATVLKYALLLAIDVGLTLPDIPKLLQDGALLRGAVTRCRLPEVKAYFAERFPRERQGSVASLLSRLDALLMYPALRRMLSARGMVRFDRLIESAVTIVDLGHAPAGMGDISRFFGQLLFQKLVRAIFARRIRPDTPPVTVMADEFQELVAPDVAHDFERFLTLARSQRVFLWAMFQQAAQVEAVSPTLLRVLRTNTNYQTLFRSSEEDARVLRAALPVTGTALREREGFADPRNPPHVMTEEEERRIMVEAVPRMPDRLMWFWNKRRQYPAILVQSPTVPVRVLERRAGRLEDEVRAHLKRGVLAVSAEEMATTETARAAYRDELAGRGGASDTEVMGVAPSPQTGPSTTSSQPGDAVPDASEDDDGAEERPVSASRPQAGHGNRRARGVRLG